MNRYPLWKYIVIAVSLLLGLFYSLPNYYGNEPAVQISSDKSAIKVDTATVQNVERILSQEKIPYTNVKLEGKDVSVRFGDVDIQAKGATALREQLGESYIVAQNLLPRSPKWLTNLGALPMYLGLDLRGGVHFLLEMDTKSAYAKAMERNASDVRSNLREKKIPYDSVSRRGDAVRITFPNAEARDKGKEIIAERSKDLSVKEVQDGSVLTLVASLRPEALKERQELDIKQNLTTLRKRVNELGVAEPIIQQQGLDRIVVELPGIQDTTRAKKILGRTATLELHMADYSDVEINAAVQGQVPLGAKLLREQDGERGSAPILVSNNIVLTGEYITGAGPDRDEYGKPAVRIELDARGSRIFQQLTRENVGKRMAILLIEKGQEEVITAPKIISEIPNGRVQITGNFSADEANNVALLLRAGALAAPMEIIEERTVGPSLGADNIARGFNSTMIGFALIALFMMVYYRTFGFIASFALAVNVLFLIGILSLLQATLTLPGIAGIALTVGMAIDANVLIFERVREELRNGNSPQMAIHAGYDRAWDTIFDSNITTLIAGFFLFWLGSGPVRGFAVVLCIGILTSMFSAVTVSRGIVNLTYGRVKKLDKLSIG